MKKYIAAIISIALSSLVFVGCEEPIDEACAVAIYQAETEAPEKCRSCGDQIWFGGDQEDLCPEDAAKFADLEFCLYQHVESVGCPGPGSSERFEIACLAHLAQMTDCWPSLQICRGGYDLP
ncbi:hypothetical protein [Polyangium spumosum]|uniref:Lipoprotein n=1 Tax=Polyangium spumosum TaxID=889282 RepID=A0A6N7Q192_9BACT|nr:hypothetical protein [Polyangium spumosum]MRG96004.1 hypothetical protein [Polyangium spumosum]